MKSVQRSVKYIIVGCDLHEENMLLKIAEDYAAPKTMICRNNLLGRKKLIANLNREAERTGARVEFAYEACCLGYVLYDELTAAGISCHVPAPSKMASTPKSRMMKTDEKDAHHIFEVLRGHCLA